MNILVGFEFSHFVNEATILYGMVYRVSQINVECPLKV